MMDIVTGPPVVGDQFFGREKELQRMFDILTTTKASLFIPGPRRIGKTSLAKEFIRKNDTNFNFLYFNIQGKNSVVELCEDLIKQLQENFSELVKSKLNLAPRWNMLAQMLPGIKIANIIDIKTGQLTKDAKKLLNKMETILQKVTEENVIIVLDEFSDFLFSLKKASLKEVESFLAWLRDLRQQEKVRLIITGSINILSTVNDMNVPDLINDLTDVDILPLTEIQTSELLSQLLSSKDIVLDKKPMQYAAEQLNDGIPFYIQLFADGVAQYAGSGSRIHNEKTIKELYNRITNKNHKEFENFHSRLTEYLDSVETVTAQKVLAHLANDQMTFDELYSYVEQSMPERQHFHRLMRRLVDECYIISENETYDFVSPMLKAWWKNKYGWEKE